MQAQADRGEPLGGATQAAFCPLSQLGRIRRAGEQRIGQCFCESQPGPAGAGVAILVIIVFIFWQILAILRHGAGGDC